MLLKQWRGVINRDPAPRSCYSIVLMIVIVNANGIPDTDL